MGLYGADVAQLRGLAALLRKEADAIERDVASALATTLRGSTWRGDDADSFRGVWTQRSMPQLRAVAGALREASGVVSRNAQEQDTASAAGSDPGGAPAASSATAGSPRPRQGRYGAHRDDLDLAFAEYSREPGHKGALPDGWDEVSSAELKKLGIDPKVLGVAGDDFNATLFRSVDGRYVLAFEGTDPTDARDWVTDAVGTVLYPSQIQKAVRAAVEVKTRLEKAGVDGSSLTYTGHSLGGEQAAVASVATGSEAVTFNAAGLSRASYGAASLAYAELTGHPPSPLDAESRVTAYTSSIDPVSIAQDLSRAPNSFGVREVLFASLQDVGDPIHNHMDEPLKAGLERKMAEEP